MKKSNELFNEILGLQKPWEVERVALSLEENEVTIYVKYNFIRFGSHRCCHNSVGTQYFA
jgi:hypothetical protein